MEQKLKKYRMTYNDWLHRYKDRDVRPLTLNEHTAWRQQYEAWRKGNIEKVH